MVMVNGQNGISGEDLIWRIEKIAIFGRDLFWQTEKNAKFGRHFFLANNTMREIFNVLQPYFNMKMKKYKHRIWHSKG